MPFERGKPRPKTAGRRKGSVNKRTALVEDAKQVCERLGFDPMEALVKLSQDENKIIALGAAKEVCKYVYTQKRSVELTGADNGPIKVQEIHPAVVEFKDLMKNLVHGAKVKS